jgi:glutamate racemase
VRRAAKRNDKDDHMRNPRATVLLSAVMAAVLVTGPRAETIVVTDSGLGGLAVVAALDSTLLSSAFAEDVEIVFCNALFDASGGYNSLPERSDRILLFSRALAAMAEAFHPDQMLIACNTLSVLYPETEFAARTGVPVTGIIEPGVDLIAARLLGRDSGTVILFGTETTVEEGVHAAGLAARGIASNRIVTQACPQLASYIELGYDSDATGLLIDAYVGDALASAADADGPLTVSLNCTHYGYALPAWEAAFATRGVSVDAFLNPNASLARAATLPPAVGGGAAGRVRVRVVSQAAIAPEVARSLARWLDSRSPATAAALLRFEHRPDLFPWRDVTRTEARD